MVDFKCACECMQMCLPWTECSAFGAREVQEERTSGCTQGFLLFLHPGQQ